MRRSHTRHGEEVEDEHEQDDDVHDRLHPADEAHHDHLNVITVERVRARRSTRRRRPTKEPAGDERAGVWGELVHRGARCCAANRRPPAPPRPRVAARPLQWSGRLAGARRAVRGGAASRRLSLRLMRELEYTEFEGGGYLELWDLAHDLRDAHEPHKPEQRDLGGWQVRCIKNASESERRDTTTFVRARVVLCCFRARDDAADRRHREKVAASPHTPESSRPSFVRYV